MPNAKLKLKIFFLAILFCSIFGLTNSASAVDRVYYFSQAGLDTNTGLTEGSPFKTLKKMQNLIDNKLDGDIYTIKLKKGDTWTLTSSTGDTDNPILFIDKPNVTLDCYGTSPDKPIIDGALTYPDAIIMDDRNNPPPYVDIPTGYAITVSEYATVDFGSVYIKNIRFQNLLPGGGIIFKGTNTGVNKHFIGPGSVENCEFDTIGWAGIQIHGVRASDANHKILIENNSVTKCAEYSRITAQHGWPQSIQTGMASAGHECRFNKVWNNRGEGIGAGGFIITEYNMVWGNGAPGIYTGPSSQFSYIDPLRIIRYNLLWSDETNNVSGFNYDDQVHIRLDDEGCWGDNTDRHWEIYGNICIGGYEGISVRNNPLNPNDPACPGDENDWSPYGSIKIYNNTVIDTKFNYYFARPQRHGIVDMRNNASIISNDVKDTCIHLNIIAQDGVDPLGDYTISSNFWFGDDWTSETNLLPYSDFINGTHYIGTTHPLPKTSGWRTLTSLSSFDFDDHLYPAATSQLVDNAKALPIALYEDYLTTGTDWETLPTENFVLVDQDEEGSNWDFGAIINQQGDDTTPPSAPTGLVVE